MAQDKIQWMTIEKAYELTQKEENPKKIFIDVYTDWCGWCKKLQREVFFTPEFQKWANENVVLMELDFPRRTPVTPELKKQNGELQQMFGVRGYPTIWFVNPSLNAETNEVNFGKIGKTGYVAGGPTGWIGAAQKILNDSN